MEKRNLSIIIVAILVVSLFPFASAGFFDFLKKGSITGRDTTGTVDFNISVTSGTPWIYDVTPAPDLTLTVGPGATYFHINFSVNDSDGAENLVNNSAYANISLGGEASRFNTSCAIVDFAGYYANFSCLIIAYWYDGNGNWEIGVNISDQNNNVGSNTTDTQTINILHGLEMYPSSLAFATLTPGIYNQTPTNHLYMNNTGNQNYVSTDIEINATDLRGEDTPGQALWAGNFSAGASSGLAACDGATSTSLSNMTYTGITNVAMNKGDYTPNDGTAQEEMYLCLRQVGAELSQQYYSTDNLGAWTVQVT